MTNTIALDTAAGASDVVAKTLAIDGTDAPKAFDANPTVSPYVVTTFAAFQSALANAPTGSKIAVMANISVTAPLAWSGKMLHIFSFPGIEITKAFSDVDPILQGSSATGSIVELMTFVGTDDAALYNAGLAGMNSNATGAYRRAAVRLAASDDVTIKDIAISSMIVGVTCDGGDRAKIKNVRVIGFGAAIAALPAASNYHTGVLVIQGSDHVIEDVSGSDIGGALVVGQYNPADASNSVPQDVTLIRPKCVSATDTAVYLSSINRATVVAPYLDGGSSAGIKIQGDDVSILGGHIEGVASGVVFSGIGTAAVYESLFAGRGLTIVGTRLVDCVARAVHLYRKSGSTAFTYLNQLTAVKIIGGCSTGGVYGTAEHTTITDITCQGVTGPALRLLGDGDSSTMAGININGGHFHACNGTAVLLSNLRKSSVQNLSFFDSEDGSGRFVRLIDCDSCDFVNLSSDAGNFVEEGTCDDNLIANCHGPVANTTSGTNHRAWVVAA